MNDDIIRMAREAGKTKWYGTHPDGTSDFLGAEFTLEQLKHFAELVRADERDLRQDAERYRWLCEFREWPASVNDAIDCGHKILIDEAIDAAIRARGNT